MYFLTFQPKDWRDTINNDRKERDAFYHKLGYMPLYAVMAGSFKTTLINAVVAEPSIPEHAIFFKTRDWCAFDKIQQYKYVIDSSIDVTLVPRKLFVETFGVGDNYIFYKFEEHMPYKHEFIVNPDSIQVLADIDIMELVTRECDPDVLSHEMSYYRDVFSQIRSGGASHEFLMRMADAKACQFTYMFSDAFYKHCTQYSNFRNYDDFADVKRVCDADTLDILYSKFAKNPSEKTYDKLVKYLEKLFE